MLKYLSVAALVASCAAAPVAAQDCGQYDAALRYLAEQHSEYVSATGMSASGNSVVVTASQVGTYTILMVSPDGVACIVDHGTDMSVGDMG